MIEDNTYRVGLVVDNPKRDLLGMCFLAKSLAEKGFNVFLIPMNLIDYELKVVQPNYLLLPGFRKGSLQRYEKFNSYGIKLGVLETEGGFYFKKQHRLNRIENDSRVEKLISNYFVWGEMFKELLLEKKALTEKKIHVVGHPRMQLIKETFSKKNKADSVLFCSSFASVGADDKLRLDVIEILEKKGTTNAIEYYRGLDNVKKEFIQLALLLDKLGYNVIYRPHPFEDFQSYKTKFKGSKIQLDEEKSTLPSLSKSFLHIHNSSTTSVEAVICGVPTIIPDYIKNGYKVAASREISYLAKSRKELLKLVQQASRGELNTSSLSESLKYVLDININSVEIISTIISKMKFAEVNVSSNHSFRYDFKYFLKRIKSQPFNPYVYFKYLIMNKLTSWDKSFKAYKIKDVETFFINDNMLEIQKLKKSRSIKLLKKKNN